eukprot:15364611-Ditylum_brightwellii.AAC.1
MDALAVLRNFAMVVLEEPLLPNDLKYMYDFSTRGCLPCTTIRWEKSMASEIILDTFGLYPASSNALFSTIFMT